MQQQSGVHDDHVCLGEKAGEKYGVRVCTVLKVNSWSQFFFFFQLDVCRRENVCSAMPTAYWMSLHTSPGSSPALGLGYRLSPWINSHLLGWPILLCFPDSDIGPLLCSQLSLNGLRWTDINSWGVPSGPRTSKINKTNRGGISIANHYIATFWLASPHRLCPFRWLFSCVHLIVFACFCIYICSSVDFPVCNLYEHPLKEKEKNNNMIFVVAENLFLISFVVSSLHNSSSVFHHHFLISLSPALSKPLLPSMQTLFQSAWMALAHFVVFFSLPFRSVFRL